MNSVQLLGRLTRDTDLRYSQNGTAFANNTVAVRRNCKNQNGEYESDFISIKAFGKSAEILANNFNKGSRIALTGSIQTGSYEKDGVKIYTTDVSVNNVEFVDTRNESQNNQSTGVPSNQSSNYNQNNQNVAQGNFGGNNDPFGGSSIDIDDDDLPF